MNLKCLLMKVFLNYLNYDGLSLKNDELWLDKWIIVFSKNIVLKMSWLEKSQNWKRPNRLLMNFSFELPYASTILNHVDQSKN